MREAEGFDRGGIDTEPQATSGAGGARKRLRLERVNGDHVHVSTVVVTADDAQLLSHAVFLLERAATPAGTVLLRVSSVKLRMIL